jgi:putative hemolysin
MFWRYQLPFGITAIIQGVLFMKFLVVMSVVLSAFNAMPAFAGGGSSIGIGNPASKNCGELGGILKSYQSPRGEGAYCVVDEWNLFRLMSQCRLVQVHHYGRNGQIGMPNPASVNCADVGGVTRVVKTPTGERGVCVVEEWMLFRSVDAAKCLQQR